MEHHNRHPLGLSVTIMILASIVIGYYLSMTIILRNNNTNNLNRIYQSLLMGFWMGLVEFLMIVYFAHLDISRYLLLIIFLLGGIILFTYLIYTQTGINENQFMLSMIGHHQMGIEMARLAQSKIQDPRVSRLAENIIMMQEEETHEIQAILEERRVPQDITALLF